MADERRRTAEEIAEELTEIAVAHLDTLSADEREKRIQAFEKRVATSCRRATDSTKSSSARTRPIPVYARDRERN